MTKSPYELRKEAEVVKSIISKPICSDQILVYVSPINVHQGMDTYNCINLSQNSEIRNVIEKVLKEMNNKNI